MNEKRWKRDGGGWKEKELLIPYQTRAKETSLCCNPKLTFIGPNLLVDSIIIIQDS